MATVKSNIPKLPDAKTFTQAVSNLSTALNSIDILNVNSADITKLNSFAKKVRDFDSKDLGPNAQSTIQRSNDAIDKINAIEAQKLVSKNAGLAAKNWWERGEKGKSDKAKSELEAEKLARLRLEANQNKSRYIESLSRFGIEDVVKGVGGKKQDVENLGKAITELSAGKVVGTGGLDSKLNIQVSNSQILEDINNGRRNNLKSLYEAGNAVITDLQSQLSAGNVFLDDLAKNDPRRAATQKKVNELKSQLATAQSDTLKAKNLYEKYVPISGSQATKAISEFREKLKLPEERTLAQIDQIDPNFGATVRTLSEQYKKLAETPTGPTTTAQTEELRSNLEQEALNQLRLGSTLGAEEQRQYQQAARAAQTARGNIFGVAPAVQEAVETGAAGEARKLARYGAASQFLSSGETTGAALARDVTLRNALEQNRLGAAQQFVASGPNPYNLSSERLAQQQNYLNNYLAASQPRSTTQFATTPTATTPYQYTNPTAVNQMAQNATQLYGINANLAADQYRTLMSGYNASLPQSGSSTFAQYAGGIGNIITPLAGAFKSYSLGGAV
jgi:hypothetical protein